MAITSKTVSAPKTSTSASKARVPASYSTGKAGSAPKVRGNIAKTIARSSKRMHQAAKITDQRPEILAMLDFKPLYATGGNLTLAGKMFKARVSERSQTLEAIRDMLTELEDTLPDEFTAATNQYASALAATEADIALLKLMILLREYATHSARFVDFKGDVCIIPPNSFALARSIEYFRIPRDVLTICVGKSTYARCGLIVNVTPFEPEWEGYVTLEISNTTPLAAKIYSNEGLCQVLFFQSDEECKVSYKDREGKYQKQKGITLPKMKEHIV